MKTLTKLSSIFLVFFLFFVLCSLSSISYADIPRLITYQGKLTDPQGKPVEDKAHSITFRIYDAETAGALLWEETQSVTTQKGILSVLLGSVTALNLPFDKPYFLETKIGQEVISPRQRMASVGYAIKADTAGKLSSNLPVTNLNSGTGASTNTFWRGDGAWASPPSYAVLTYSGTSVFSGASPNQTYTDLDLSGTVGINRALVLLKFKNNGSSYDYYTVRTNGDTDGTNSALNDLDPENATSLYRVGSVYAGYAAYVLVQTDASGVIEWTGYFAKTTVITLVAYIK